MLKPFINDIYNGFNDMEKPAIINRDLSDIPTHLENTDAQPLWPLSVDEANALPSDDFRKTSGENNHWWLRTQGTGIDNVVDVNGSTGEVQSYGNNAILNYLFRARPAFYLDLQEILFISASTKAGGGKASNTVGKGALKEVASYTGTSWKLTLKDDGTGIAAMNGHAGFSAALTDNTSPVRAGEDISVEYSGAVANASGNEYVSAMLCDSDGKDVLYYGRLKQIETDTDKSGTLPVTIPASVAAGDYKLKIFSEQYNGDNMTDLASNVISIDLTVLAAHKHSFTSHVTKPATCTETGVMTYTCSCGYSYTSSIPVDSNNHAYDGGVVTTEPTIFTEGIRTFTCSRCGDSYTESITKLTPSSGEETELLAEYNELIKELTNESGELIVEVEIKTEKKEDGTTETIILVSGNEVIRIITDKDGEETVETNIWSISGDEVYVYTGKAIKPEPYVYDGLTRLKSGNDFDVSYSNNVNAGTKPTATISFKGGYSGTPKQKVNFTIKQATLSENCIVEHMEIPGNGKVQKPVPVVTLKESGKVISKGSLKYTYLDSDGKEVSGVKDTNEYTVIIQSKNNKNLTGTTSAGITVIGDINLILSNATVKFNPDKYTYTGEPIVPKAGSYTLNLNGSELVEGTDYEVEDIRNNEKPGKATVIFKAMDGNAKGLVGKKKATFTISKGRGLVSKETLDTVFTYSYKERVPYAKGGTKPDVIIKDNGRILKLGSDYSVSYRNNKSIARADAVDSSGKSIAPQIIVKGKGNYAGSVTLPYEITSQSITALSGNVIALDKTESKSGYQKPVIRITDLNGKKLETGKDFDIDPDSYTGPDENGIVTVNVKGIGSYTDSIPVTYRYIKADAHLSKVKAKKIAAKIYTGKEIKLKKSEAAKLLYTMVDGKETYLTPGEDFVVTGYEKNIKKGTAKVTLRGIGNYGGEKTVTFKIVSRKSNIIQILLKGGK